MGGEGMEGEEVWMKSRDDIGDEWTEHLEEKRKRYETRDKEVKMQRKQNDRQNESSGIL